MGSETQRHAGDLGNFYVWNVDCTLLDHGSQIHQSQNSVSVSAMPFLFIKSDFIDTQIHSLTV